MANKLTQWIDERTGYKALIHEALDEPIPGGAKWRYVFGSALTSVFFIQVITGLLLMCSYSPSSSTAWGSVYYISHEMTAGWLIRGIHHFGSQAMVILLACHLIQVLIAGAYRAPREFNWWFGLILMFLTLGLSLTGYLLPWDQKGYWATKVATNIAGIAPVVGPSLQRAIVGGSDYGNQTLTRFYGLHVGVLPALLIMMLVAHIALFRRHGVTAPRNARGEGKFWPVQVFMDVLVSLLILGILVLLVVSEGGANLDAPADPSSSDYPARPEWYFLSLFQMLKKPWASGAYEFVGAFIIPGAVVAVFAIMPFFDKVLPKGLAHFLACSFTFALIGGAGYLTWEAVKEDQASEQFQATRAQAEEARLRALQLAGSPEVGIPPDGPSYLLMRDPWTRGRAVLGQKCLSCHYDGGKGQPVNNADGTKGSSPQVASDLKGFGSKEWLAGMLANPKADAYFGKVPQSKGMVTWKGTTKLSPEEIAQVTDFVASFASIPEDVTPSEWYGSLDADKFPGIEAFQKDCLRCHECGPEGMMVSRDEVALEQEAPNLFAWGSPQWIKRMIRKPGSPEHYPFLEGGERMPAFPEEQLTDGDLEALVRYIKGDYLPPPTAEEAKAHAHKGE